MRSQTYTQSPPEKPVLPRDAGIPHGEFSPIERDRQIDLITDANTALAILDQVWRREERRRAQEAEQDAIRADIEDIDRTLDLVRGRMAARDFDLASLGLRPSATWYDIRKMMIRFALKSTI
jgi:hypothetical protein